MQIRRFFVPELPDTADAVITLPERESLHALRVLRLEAGDRMTLLDGCGGVAEAVLLQPESRHSREARCQITSARRLPPPAPLTLLVAPPRGKAFDLVLKAAAELCFTAIQPLLCQYGTARPEGTSEAWRQTLVAAVKQSANPWMPELREPMPFAAALTQFGGENGLFGASPAAEATARQRHDGRGISALWVGPEGGFAPTEEQAMLDCGLLPVTLGNAVLRVETAVPALAGYIYAVRNSI